MSTRCQGNSAMLNQLPPGIHVGNLSHVGRERKRNEDSYYVMQSAFYYEDVQETFALSIVADGMGGQNKGEIASSLAVRTCANRILQKIYHPYLTSDQNVNNRPLQEDLIAAVIQTNQVVQEQVPGGGTTLTTTLIMGNTAYLAHIGDTRAYVFKDDTLRQITKDHSLASRLEEMGQSAPEEIAKAQSVLYRAIGQTDLSKSDVDSYVQHLPSGASLLVCTDGLWGLINNETIMEILVAASTPQQACEQLVDAANQSGGRDNVTVVIVSIGAES